METSAQPLKNAPIIASVSNSITQLLSEKRAGRGATIADSEGTKACGWGHKTSLLQVDGPRDCGKATCLGEGKL